MFITFCEYKLIQFPIIKYLIDLELGFRTFLGMSYTLYNFIDKESEIFEREIHSWPILIYATVLCFGRALQEKICVQNTGWVFASYANLFLLICWKIAPLQLATDNCGRQLQVNEDNITCFIPMFSS